MSTPSAFGREIRLAVVMYGGVSLAIYINGVAQELLALVRATATRPDGTGPLVDETALSEVERLYREIGRRLNQPDPYAPLEAGPPARLVVDVIAGTSAGGLNGLFLAKALANHGSMETLKQLWIQEGDLALLLNDAGSLRDLRLRGRPPGFPTSVLNSQRMLARLFGALRTMGGDEHAQEPVLADELDLFVTATDLHGLVLPIRLANGVVFESRHKSTFHFVGATARATGGRRNDFDRDNDAFLAYAGRCTSSFPVAFEPMQLADLERIADALRSVPMSDEDLRAWERFYADYMRDHALEDRRPEQRRSDFAVRPFGDGGYLDNKPFGRAIDALQWRQAGPNVERKLVYVEPSPEHPELEVANGRPDPFTNLVDAASALPRAETIREDLERVVERNRAIEHVVRATRSLPRDAEDGFRSLVSPSLRATQFVQGWLADGIRRFGASYGAYHRLKVAGITSELAEVVARVGGLDERSDDLLAARILMSAWRQVRYDSEPPTDAPTLANRRARRLPTAWQSENQLLLDYDLGYRLRRVAFVRDILKDLATLQPPRGPAAPATGATPRGAGERALEWLEGVGLGDHADACRASIGAYQDELQKVFAQLSAMYVKLRVAGRNLRSRSERNPLAAAIRGLALSIAERRWVLEPEADAMRVLRARWLLGLVEDADREWAAALVVADSAPPAAAGPAERRELLARAATDAAGALRAAMVESSGLFDAIAPAEALDEQGRLAPPVGDARDVVRRCLRRYYDRFEYYDMVLFPMVYQSGIGEIATVDIVRVSPEDAPGLLEERDRTTRALRMKKLAGTRLGNFGAFLDATWRRSDILWGRLDAAEILLRHLLPGPEDGYAAAADTRDRLILRVQAAILASDLLPLGCEKGRRVLVEAFLHAPKGPDEAALTRLLDRLALVVDAGSPLAALLARDEVMRAYQRAWASDRSLAAPVAHRLIARSVIIFGRLLEGLSNAGGGVKQKAGRALALAGRVAWGLVEVAIPKSLWSVLARNWLQVLYLLEVLMLLGGLFLPGVAVAKTIGLQSLLATLGVHAVIALLNLQYRGVRRVWWFVLVVLALAVAVLAFIGGLRVWGWLAAAWARLPGR